MKRCSLTHTARNAANCTMLLFALLLAGCASTPRPVPPQAAAPQSAAAAPQTVTAQPRMWNVLAAGAIADGTSDNTALFQRLLDEASQAGGGIVEVPAGRYAIHGNLRIPTHVTLRGVTTFAPVPATIESSLNTFAGSVLQAYAGRGSRDGDPFILLAGHNAALQGLTIVYPEWRREDVPPVPYPPCIQNTKMVDNISISDCQLINPYEGIRMDEAQRFRIQNVMGYPILRGLLVDFCADISRIENVHFWPFNVIYKAEDPYCVWINKNGVAFEFARTDWQYVLNTFCFGYAVGYKFSDLGRGGANGSFVGIGADSCQEAVRVEAIQPYGLQIVNGEFVGRWSSMDAVTFQIGENVAGKVSLMNCNFWGPIDRCIWMRAAKGQLTAIGCNFVAWDVRKAGSPALQLDAGKAILQGNTFGAGRHHVHVGPQVQSALISGNQGEQGVEINNHAGKRLQSMMNEPFAPDAKK